MSIHAFDILRDIGHSINNQDVSSINGTIEKHQKVLESLIEKAKTSPGDGLSMLKGQWS